MGMAASASGGSGVCCLSFSSLVAATTAVSASELIAARADTNPHAAFVPHGWSIRWLHNNDGHFASLEDLLLNRDRGNGYDVAVFAQSGEVAGLRRLRAFTMPDCHALCADVEEAKKELEKKHFEKVRRDSAS
jgi:hypothetical protein